jgi:spectinomycin phosphotransferase
MTLLMERWREIRVLMARAQQLALQLQSQELELVLCHADLHAGNLLVENDGTLYIIDWDEILLAPKERDLMYIGGGLLGGWRSPAEEEALFYQGYGSSEIDPVALAYYRYERIIQDLAIYSEELLSVHGSREEREQSFRYMASNFNPGGVLEIARLSDGA